MNLLTFEEIFLICFHAKKEQDNIQRSPFFLLVFILCMESLGSYGTFFKFPLMGL